MLKYAFTTREPGAEALAASPANAEPCRTFNGGCGPILARLFDRTVEMDRGYHFRRDGEDSRAVFALREGWAARYLHLPEGRRQIVELLLPGDLFPVHRTAGAAGEGIVALKTCRAALCTPRALENAALEYPALARSLWLLTGRNKRIFRAWIANLGQRDSYARTAHLICEISERLMQAGGAHGGAFVMPMTQEDMADATGITYLSGGGRLVRRVSERS